MQSKMIAVAKAAEKVNLEDTILDGRDISLQVKNLISLFVEDKNSDFYDPAIMESMFDNSRHCTNIVMTIIASVSLELDAIYPELHSDLGVLGNIDEKYFIDYYSIHREAIAKGFSMAPQSAQLCFSKAVSTACAKATLAMFILKDIRIKIKNRYLIESLARTFGFKNTALNSKFST